MFLGHTFTGGKLTVGAGVVTGQSWAALRSGASWSPACVDPFLVRFFPTFTASHPPSQSRFFLLFENFSQAMTWLQGDLVHCLKLREAGAWWDSLLHQLLSTQLSHVAFPGPSFLVPDRLQGSSQSIYHQKIPPCQ